MSVCVIFAAAFSCTDPVQEGVEVAGVSLDKNELRLKVGESGNLVATVVPSNADDNWWKAPHVGLSLPLWAAYLHLVFDKQI